MQDIKVLFDCKNIITRFENGPVNSGLDCWKQKESFYICREDIDE